jgi:hypothetical protein
MFVAAQWRDIKLLDVVENGIEDDSFIKSVIAVFNLRVL